MFLSDRSTDDVHARFTQSESRCLCKLAHSGREKPSCSDLICQGVTATGLAEVYVKVTTSAETRSIVQDQIGQHFYPHFEFSVVLNESHRSEFVHEVRDARPRRAHHFGQGFVTQHGDAGIRRDSVFT